MFVLVFLPSLVPFVLVLIMELVCRWFGFFSSLIFQSVINWCHDLFYLVLLYFVVICCSSLKLLFNSKGSIRHQCSTEISLSGYHSQKRQRENAEEGGASRLGQESRCWTYPGQIVQIGSHY